MFFFPSKANLLLTHLFGKNKNQKQMERTSPGLSPGPRASLNVGASENFLSRNASHVPSLPGQEAWRREWGEGVRREGRGTVGLQ